MSKYDLKKAKRITRGVIGHNKSRRITARNQRRVDRKKAALKAAREMFKP